MASRRLPGLLLVLVLLVLRSSGALAADPSILLVTIDTWRADRVGRPSDSITPYVDALTRDGIRFTRAMVQVPITLPSHVSILTGTYPVHHGVRDFGGFYLEEGVETLAETLQRQGYATAAFVSSFALDSTWGLDQGFDVYHDHFDLSRYRGIGFNAVERRGDETVDLALDWLSQNQARSFFLWVHLFDPHDPYDPPEPYRTRFAKRLYDGEVAFADSQFGRLVEAFKEAGLYDSSLIIVMGDHGEGLGEHGEDTHGFFVYNSTLHIPLILKLPDNASAGTVVDTLVQSLDVAPTVLQVLRLRGDGLQGRGFLSLIRGANLRGGDFAYGESLYAHYHFGWSSLLSYQDQRYKYIRVPKRELYDLQTDPGETRNLYAEQLALGQQYDNLLNSLVAKFGKAARPAAAPAEIDEATRQRLQSLGYVAVSAGKSTLGDDANRADPKDKIHLFNAIRLATLDTEKGQFDASIRRLAEVIKKDSGIYTARYLQGFNYFQTAQFMLAVNEFKEALSLFPDSPRAVHSLAMSYFHLGMTEAAGTGFEQLIRLQASNPQGYLGLGDVYFKEKKLEPARRQYEKALQLGDRAAGRLGLGRVLVAQGELDAGIEQFKTVLQQEPRSAQAHLLLSYTYRQKGMMAEARQHLEKARTLGLKERQ